MIKGITEKSNNGLFENEVEFNGKYATYVRYLKEDVGLFATFREGYIMSAIIGYLNSSKETEDDTPKVQSASIFPNELTKKKRELRFLYRLMMLTEDQDSFTIDDYKNRAFKDDNEENAEQLKSNMDAFNSYVCGGLEFLYDKFKDCDNEEKTAAALYNLVNKFAEDIGLKEAEELPDFMPEFN